MQTPLLKKVNQFIEHRSRREQKMLFGLFCFFIGLIWYKGFYAPLLMGRQDFIQQRTTIITDITNLDTQLLLSNTKAATLKSQYDALEKENTVLNHELSRHLITSSEYIQTTAILKDLFQKQNNLHLITIDSQVSVQKLDTASEHLISHETIDLIFTGGFFDTLKFLKKLEEIRWPWHIDIFTYAVETYPNAKITLKITTHKQTG